MLRQWIENAKRKIYAKTGYDFSVKMSDNVDNVAPWVVGVLCAIYYIFFCAAVWFIVYGLFLMAKNFHWDVSVGIFLYILLLSLPCGCVSFGLVLLFVFIASTRVTAKTES